MLLPSHLSTLTKKMIGELYMCDIHVHLPGTISPQTAWQLGIKNNLIQIQKKGARFVAKTGLQKLHSLSNFKSYLEIFDDTFYFDKEGNVKNVRYKFTEDKKFRSFDAIMAAVQGHRFPPGGIQNIGDLHAVFDDFLRNCVEQRIHYVELQQNIKIAYLLYPDSVKITARQKLFLLFQTISNTFSKKGIILKFLHCFNKTSASGEALTTRQRTIEAAQWLREAEAMIPGLFVGIESAGHEKDQSGWPIHLKEGYNMVQKLGMGCEAHGGEGIGVEHMLDVAKTLPITRMAHGFQVIEEQEAIDYIRTRDLTLVMTPIINLNLGMCVHAKRESQILVPCSKTNGGIKTSITQLHLHPFFDLFRKQKLKITLCSDNPNLGGIPLKGVVEALANLSSEHRLPKDFLPLAAEELAILSLNGIKAIFATDETKSLLKEKLIFWVKKYNLNQDYIHNFYGQ
jgi:adenosine deaminase